MISPFTRARISKVLAIGLLAGLFCAPAAFAQDERKIAATKERIHQLAGKAEWLKERGRVNEAEKLLLEAKKLKSWLAKASKGRKQGGDDYDALFGNLKHAIHALKELGRKEEAQKLAHFTEQLWADLHRKRERKGREHREGDERAEAKRQLQVLGYAKAAFAEEGKRDALEMIEREMHARELKLAGRRDREAREIMGRAPKREEVIELLGWATKILAEYRAHEKAAAVKKLAGQMKKQGQKRRDGARTEREAARHQVEVLQFAAGVLDKANRGDAAERMEHAAKALGLRLEGAGGERVERFLKQAPGREEIAKLLGLTTEILQDWGQRDRAEMVAKVARQFAPRRRSRELERGQQRERRRDRRTDTDQRMEELTRRLERMARALEELQEQVYRLKRQTR